MPTVIEDRSCRDEQIENMIHDAFGYHPSNERVDPVEEVVPNEGSGQLSPEVASRSTPSLNND
ncbi:uncharacterized protein G2W53_035454 [Senna tora]|uniref:Uncharacterized protein n=1 Tax=Senna tora TaxID=362788 RepID=A0A834SSY3_9FABA|nr:uncharacterized protein G2W53_035454 [Senna tora]